MDLGLKDKVVVITGGSSGIGLQCVKSFLKEGAKVATCARGAQKLEQAKKDLLADGYDASKIFTMACDVLDDEKVKDFANAVTDYFGVVDILVLNAGQARVSTFAQTSDDDWLAELNLKIFSVVRPIRAFKPLLDKSECGAITIVNSLLALQPEPHMVCTSSARASVQNLLKSLSVEFAPSIRVNGILIGTINSGQWAKRYAQRLEDGVISKDLSFDEWLLQLAQEKKIPLARMGRSEEAADAIIFLSSPKSSFTTGATLQVAGGVSRFI